MSLSLYTLILAQAAHLSVEPQILNVHRFEVQAGYYQYYLHKTKVGPNSEGKIEFL